MNDYWIKNFCYSNIKVKLLENGGNHLNPAHKIAYSSHSSLASHSSNNTNNQNGLNMQQSHNHHHHHHNPASTNSTSNVNGSLLLFNKQKRSSSIDNVISSFTSNSQPLTFSNAYGVDNKTSNSRTGRENPQANKNNLYFSGNDLKDLLDSFNINTSKLTNGEARTIHPNSNDMNPAVNNPDNSNRSRSLHRDPNSSMNYMDKNNQRRKLLIDSASTNQKSSANLSNNNNNSNYPSSYNQLMARNQYDLINSQQKFLDDSNQSILFSNNDLNSSSSSHVVPKPPPGNPQRNTNLYPAARLFFSTNSLFDHKK